MKELQDLLQTAYGIRTVSMFPAKGGFSTKAAYRVVSGDGTAYFVKAYDTSWPTTDFFVGRIGQYMPVLRWLSSAAALRGRVLSPVPTVEGLYQAQRNNTVYVVFLFVCGEVPGIQGMTRAQTVELAEILAALHTVGSAVPFETSGLQEDISLPFCSRLIQFMGEKGRGHKALWEAVSPHSDMLCEAASEALLLRDTVRCRALPIVLCHGDAHGNNVIQSDRLVLADWEDLRWAPAEADLFISAWHPYGQTLLEAYAAKRDGYCINRQLLYFYTLRRRLEDVWVNIQRLTEEPSDEAEAAELLDHIGQGMETLRECRKEQGK